VELDALPKSKPSLASTWLTAESNKFMASRNWSSSDGDSSSLDEMELLSNSGWLLISARSAKLPLAPSDLSKRLFLIAPGVLLPDGFETPRSPEEPEPFLGDTMGDCELDEPAVDVTLDLRALGGGIFAKKSGLVLSSFRKNFWACERICTALLVPISL